MLVDFVGLIRQHGFAAGRDCGMQPFAEWQAAVQAKTGECPPADPREVYPWANGLWVLGVAYVPFDTPSECLDIPAYYFASNAAYHAGQALARELTAMGMRAEVADELPYRAAAVRAGVGEQGDNGLFFWDGYGSRVCLCLMAIERAMPLDFGTGAPTRCLHCGLCTARCPAKALSGNGWVSADCLREDINEFPGSPERDRLVGRRAFGCDTCQAVCPAQVVPATIPHDDYARLYDIEAILADGDLTGRSRAVAAQLGKNLAKPERLYNSALRAKKNGE